MRKSYRKGTLEQFVAEVEDQIARLNSSDVSSSTAVTSATTGRGAVPEHVEYLPFKDYVAMKVAEGSAVDEVEVAGWFGLSPNNIDTVYFSTNDAYQIGVSTYDGAFYILADGECSEGTREEYFALVSPENYDGPDIAEYAEALGQEIVGLLEAQGFEAYASVEGDYLEIEIEGEEDAFIQPLDEITPMWEDLNLDASTLADEVIDQLFS